MDINSFLKPQMSCLVTVYYSLQQLVEKIFWALGGTVEQIQVEYPWSGFPSVSTLFCLPTSIIQTKRDSVGDRLKEDVEQILKMLLCQSCLLKIMWSHQYLLFFHTTFISLPHPVNHKAKNTQQGKNKTRLHLSVSRLHSRPFPSQVKGQMTGVRKVWIEVNHWIHKLTEVL